MSGEPMIKNDWGVYVHIPFCKSKCAYCDFYSHISEREFREVYALAVIRHIQNQSVILGEQLSSVPRTVFMGGGTPSLLPSTYVAEILKTIKERFGISEPAEVTVEANPGRVSQDDLCRWLEGGCNRISLGVQAFQPRLLSFLGRNQSVADIRKAVETAQKVALFNISLDLIYGIPGQTLDDWRLSLKLAVELGPTHLSLYNLKPEVGTPMVRWLQKGLAVPCDEDVEVEMYEFARQYLNGKGYRQYELSNFAQPGFECKHNLNYWQRGDYLGFGSGATSGVGLRRWTWIADSKAYVSALREHEPVSLEEEEWVDPHVAAGEAIILGLRRTEGVDLAAISREYGVEVNIFTQWDKISRELTSQGWIEYFGSRIALKPKAYLIANEILARYLTYSYC